jgi:hypothetical protein
MGHDFKAFHSQLPVAKRGGSQWLTASRAGNQLPVAKQGRANPDYGRALAYGHGEVIAHAHA